MSMIEILQLTRDYGNKQGIFDLSISVQQGEVFGLLGPNGAGKTTTIRHLMGFLKPEQGSCVIDKMNCWSENTQIQKNLGYIPGEMAYFDNMMGDAYLRFLEKYRGMKDSGRKKELLERFELNPHNKLKKMSKGTKQKIGIVSAFFHDPAILILDEPTSGLDPLMQNRFIDLLVEEKEKGKTILLSSHMFEEIERTCNRVGIIRQGKLVAVNSVDALKEAQVRQYVITFESLENVEKFKGENLEITNVQGTQITVKIQKNIRQMLAILQDYPVTNITAPNQSLEEIFLQYYGGAENA